MKENIIKYIYKSIKYQFVFQTCILHTIIKLLSCLFFINQIILKLKPQNMSNSKTNTT